MIIIIMDVRMSHPHEAFFAYMMPRAKRMVLIKMR